MKNILIWIGLMGSCISPMAQEKSTPPNKGISGYLEMNYYRHYIWRGASFGNDDVAQPELELKKKNWGLLFTSNLNYNTSKLPSYYTKKAIFDEQDFEINYENEKGHLEYKIAAMCYVYFHQLNSPATAEFYWKLQYPLFNSIKIFTESAHDFVQYGGAVFNNTGIVLEKNFKDRVDLTGTFLCGFANRVFNKNYNALDQNALNIISGKLELEYSIGKYYIGAMTEYNKYMNRNLKTNTGINQTNNFYFSLGRNF